MPQDHTNASTNPQETFDRNHHELLGMLRRSDANRAPNVDQRPMELSLERVLYDHATNVTVPFDGPRGIEAMLVQISHELPDCAEEWHDGHLMGLATRFDGFENRTSLWVTLGPGGQVICSVGPSRSIALMRHTIDAFDRAVHMAALALGCDYELLPEGYNSLVSSPLDVSLVPRTKWTLLSAHLMQTGRCARDAMRCSCATQLGIGYANERDAIAAYRAAVALSPLLAFLTDNVRSYRGSDARRCPRMSRSLLWEDVDPARCGIVPGTFDDDFSFERYVAWLEGIKPILITDDHDVTVSTGKKTLAEVMRERPFTPREVSRAFETVYPYVRMDTTIEFTQADALRPRMAVSVAAFVKGLFCNALSFDALCTLLDGVDEQGVRDAFYELRLRGWDAIVYGTRTTDLVRRLVEIARSGLEDVGERRAFDEIAELWDFNLVPRDAFVHQEVKQRRGW